MMHTGNGSESAGGGAYGSNPSHCRACSRLCLELTAGEQWATHAHKMGSGSKRQPEKLPDKKEML